MVNFEDTARVPLIVSAPFKPQSVGVAEQLVMLVDMYPTVVALTGAGPPLSALEGTDHSAIFDDLRAPGPDFAYTQYPRCPAGGDPSVPTGWAKNYCKSTSRNDIDWMGLSVRDRRWRFTLWLPWNGTTWSPEWAAAPEGVELYDYAGSNGSDFDA